MMIDQARPGRGGGAMNSMYSKIIEHIVAIND